MMAQAPMQAPMMQQAPLIQPEQPQPPVPFIPPCTDEELEKATELFLERLRPLIEDLWKAKMATAGFDALPEREQWAIFAAHEPLFLLTEQGVVPSEWIAALTSESETET